MNIGHPDAMAVVLRQTIERWTGTLRNRKLARLAQAGGLTTPALALYFRSLRYLFEHSQQNLVHAAARCEARGATALAAYFARKAHEEQGHDAWASADLAGLPDAAARGSEPATAIVGLVALQRALIAEHPVCFVVYALWAEYFTVLVGDEWLDLLARHGYGRERVTAIAKHLDADRAHAASGFDAIDVLWKGEPQAAALLGVIARASELFEAFCDEVSDEAVRAA